MTNIASVTLSPGKYLLQATAIFAENANGYRRLNFATTDTGTSIDRYSILQVGASPSGETILSFVFFCIISSDITVYLNAKQDSGSALNVKSIGIRRFQLDA